MGQRKKGASLAKRSKDSSCDPPKLTVPPRGDQLDPDEEENQPKASDNRPDTEVRVELQGSELWKRFYEIGTEMIITKAGRCRWDSLTRFFSTFVSLVQYERRPVEQRIGLGKVKRNVPSIKWDLFEIFNFGNWRFSHFMVVNLRVDFIVGPPRFCDFK